MMFYRNTRSPDGYTNVFDTVVGLLQRDTLAPYLLIIFLEYVIWTSIYVIKEKGFTLKKAKKNKKKKQMISPLKL